MEATHDSQRTLPGRRGPLHHQCRRLLGHRRRLRPGPGHRGPVVPVHGGTADRPQGHLGLPAEAAPRRRLHHQGHRGHGSQWRIPEVPGAPSTPSAPGPPASPVCPPAGAGTPSFIRAWPSSASSGTTSCCWPRTRPTRRDCTTASSTGAVPCPCTARWRDWLWRRGLDTGEIVPLESAGLLAYTCNPNGEELKADLSAAVAAGTLTLNEPDTDDTEKDSDG